MSKLFYPKLAVSNIRKNLKNYFPYFLTSVGIIMMFYNMVFLVCSDKLNQMYDSVSLITILGLGVWVIAIFAAIFLFYTNSFLIKQRKKEFGVFHILGMEKRHIARMMLYETLIMMLISLVVGIGAGILFSKLMLLLLFKLIARITPVGFEVPLPALLFTLLLFVGIFLVNLIYNVMSVYFSKPIDLLRGSNVGEREPKTKWLLVLLGVFSLSGGYYIALTTKSPMAALGMFFVAVILVMIGTYSLFTAGSIAVLKLLRKNKNYYYKANHFTSISGMIYRMKQNAAGLANICILSTAVILMLSTTVSLYVGMEDVLRTRFPRNINVTVTRVSDQDYEPLTQMIEQTIKEHGVEPQNAQSYISVSIPAIQNGNRFEKRSIDYYEQNITALYFVTQTEYERITGQPINLADNEILLGEIRGKVPGDQIWFKDREFQIKERVQNFNIDGNITAMTINSCCVVVKDMSVFDAIQSDLADGQDGIKYSIPSYQYGFDVNADAQTQLKLADDLEAMFVKNENYKGYVQSVESQREGFYILYGGLFFLGLFLGFLFLMATVMIIYYKQVAEGYDDKERFKIMQKVGMSHHEIKKSIHSQVLTVFFLPLITAVIHIAFAFPVVTKLLAIMNLTNVPLFTWCTILTILVFSLFYVLVYFLTAKVYYKIVK